MAHREEAGQFYRELKEQSVRVGMEASGHSRWFERLLRNLEFELSIGDGPSVTRYLVPLGFRALIALLKTTHRSTRRST